MTARIAMVTGGSRGIGRACAVALAGEDALVAILYARDDVGAAETAAAVKAIGGNSLTIRADVTNATAVDAAFKEVEDTWGRVEKLVVNAGIAQDGLLLRMTDAQWDDVLRTNLTGAFYVVRRAAASMIKLRWGRVVTIGSVVGLSGSAGQVNYAAAKAGLIGLTRSVARELASRNITANVVAPGPILTSMTDVLAQERREEIRRQIPLRRWGTPEEVAATVAFLCSDAASFITGAVVPVDGGIGMGH